MEWIGSPNHGAGRKGHKVRAVVIHVSEGTLGSMNNWFLNPVSQVSSHYAVGRRGEIVQYVKDEDTAWHAGRIKEPTAKMVLDQPTVNPNLYTIGIEHEGTGKTDFTDVQYDRSARLISLLAQRHSFPITERTVIPHRAIFSGKSCPGPIDLDRLIRAARVVGDPRPVLGSQAFSGYFTSNLTLVHWVSEQEWYFTVNRDPLRYGIQRAQSLWSSMDPPR